MIHLLIFSLFVFFISDLGIRVDGYITNGKYNSPKANYIFFVNHRLVEASEFLKSINLAYNLQLAILPLIREMKSFNFPQGFKEALSIRGINMGPPKMNYPEFSLKKLSDLKQRIVLEIDSLLNRYFGISLSRYNSEEGKCEFE